MTRLPFAKIASVALALGLTAAPAFANDLLGEWHLVGVNGLPATQGVTLQFEAPEAGKTEAAFNGQAPCNRYFGSYTADGAALSLGGVAATMMACERLSEESAYFKALEPVSEVSFLEGHLLLKGPQDTVLEYSRDATDKICISCGK